MDDEDNLPGTVTPDSQPQLEDDASQEEDEDRWDEDVEVQVVAALYEIGVIYPVASCQMVFFCNDCDNEIDIDDPSRLCTCQHLLLDFRICFLIEGDSDNENEVDVVEQH